MSSGLAFGQLIWVSIIKEKFPMQAELMRSSCGFSKNYIFLAFREKMPCSEPNQHLLRMDSAQGLSRGCEETGAQGVADLWSYSSLTDPSQTIDLSFQVFPHMESCSWNAALGWLHPSSAVNPLRTFIKEI